MQTELDGGIENGWYKIYYCGQGEIIPEVEQLNNILQRGNGEQRKYLLHMLCEMEKGMDELM